MRAITFPFMLGLLLAGCGSTAVIDKPPSVASTATDTCGIERSKREPSLATFSAAEARTCESACKEGDSRSCVTMGLAYEKGFGVHRDYEAAFERYHHACARGYVPACSREAWLCLNGLGTDLDPAKAVDMARRTCNQGDAYGCAIMGEATSVGGVVSKDVARAAVFYRRACDAGELAACGLLGALYAQGEGVMQHLETAQALLQQACTSHDPVGCFNLGRLQLARAVETQNAGANESALKLIEQSCRGGLAPACVSLGEAYTEGRIVPRDIPRAAEWYALAFYHGAASAALQALGVEARSHLKNRCTQGDAIACVVASSLFAFAAPIVAPGQASTKEAALEESAELAERGCTLGQPRACAFWSAHYAGAGALPKDLTKAKKLATASCRDGAAEGCETLAALVDGRALGKPPDYAASFSHIRRACRLGLVNACTRLGMLYTEGKGTPMNRQFGFRLLDKSCNDGDGEACIALAEYHDNGWEPVTRNVARAAQLLEQACIQGQAPACLLVGVRYFAGNGVSRDDVKGFGFVKRACDAGYEAACRSTRILSAVGWGTERDKVHGENNLRALCKEEDWGACTMLGAILAAKDAGSAEAATLWEKACNSGDANACTSLGDNHLHGKGKPKDPAKAASYISKACTLGNTYACSLLGTLYLQGQGVTASPAVAATFQKQACDAGSMRGCAALAELHEKGQGVERDFAKAAELYEKACTGEYAAACRRFGEMLVEGIGVPKKDPARGVDKLEDAARLGDTDAMTKLLDLRAEGWVAPRRLETTLQQACDKQAWPACRSLAFLWWNPPPKSLLDKRPADALTLALRACDGDDLPACGIAANAYEKGAPPSPQQKLDKGARIIPAQKAIPRDPKRALELYKKGCGDEVSFTFSAASIGLGPKTDARSTVAPVAATEQRSDGASCAEWARLEPKRAPELLERACRANYAPACAKQPKPGPK